ncbi:eukaryotic translation initiation factor 3 subunit J-like [Hyposmocoma kahamanoa]|uniref:eukaryotic translation initiation factor 3 subunit J-like n=1 Tax=Hyposmocoma kahamanoa TaxID=1477025 RepID=UPI000E6D83E6|nr:eukaryotic translation initiation factor 3 subunit J-like [Hyposmocoma kahamanoa]XP_026333074.1 eukaryotic translation initiation factor 3 subunit J-like [Hyposmocoma kahamanoa]
MDVSWDSDNFEPKLPTTLTSSNKWAGEDEEEIVKESWEDEEEEKKDEEKKEVVPPPPKPKKKIDKIAEKERQEREKAERLAMEKLVENLTPEERLAEKLRQQKLQEESDLRLAMETFGISGDSGGRLDSFHPTNKEEFTEFSDMLCKKINLYKTKEEFPVFVEELFRGIIVQMQSADIRRIKTSVDNIYIEKQKAEKTTKKPAKGKGKAKLKLDNENSHLDPETYGTFEDDYDDFM